MWKKLFWSKQMTWLRKLLGANKPKIDIEDVLNATGGPAVPPRGTYTSFSGIDVKVYFESEENVFLCVAEIQAVSVLDDPNSDKVRGTIISLIFDGDVLSALPFTPKNMLMVAANEYGTICYSRFKDFKFTAKSWGISVDDIIGEVRTDFEAESCVHWKRIADLRRFENWPENLPEQIQERLREYE